MKKHIINKDGLTIINNTAQNAKWGMRTAMMSMMLKDKRFLNYILKERMSKKRAIKFIKNEHPSLYHPFLSYFTNNNGEENITVFVNIKKLKLSTKEEMILKFYRNIFLKYKVQLNSKNLVEITNKFNRFLYRNRSKILTDLKNYIKVGSSYLWEELLHPAIVKPRMQAGESNYFLVIYALNKYDYCITDNIAKINVQIKKVLLNEKLYNISPTLYYKEIDEDEIDKFDFHEPVSNILKSNSMPLIIFGGKDSVKAKKIYSLEKYKYRTL